MTDGTNTVGSRSIDHPALIEWLDPRTKPPRHKLGLIGLGFLAVLPTLLTPLQALTVASAYFMAMFAMSWDAVSGYTGQISLGHGVFFTAGGYTSTLLNLEFGFDPLVTIPFGVLAAVLAGLLIGIPTLRLRGPYFALVTLIAPLILLRIFVVYSDVLGGTTGLTRPDQLFGLEASDAIVTYYVAFGLFVVVLGALLAVTRSDAGAVFTAIRQSEEAVSSAGLNPAKFKIFAFTLSAAVGGLAGAAFVHLPIGSPTPSSLLTLFVNVEIIIAAMIGGVGTIVGAAIGGMLLVLLREILSNLAVTVPVLGVSLAEIDTIAFAIVTIGIVYYYPDGLLRSTITLGGRIRDRVASRSNDQSLQSRQQPRESAALSDETTDEADRKHGGNGNER